MSPTGNSRYNVPAGRKASVVDEEGRAIQEELERAREEISRLRRRLADERFAEELKEALSLAATAGTIASPVTHPPSYWR